MLFGIRRFQYFLRGKPFVVKTDHQALCYIDSVDHKNAKLARWMDELSAFRFVVEYVPGEQNVWADMFSRPFGLKKAAATGTDEPAGKFVEFSDSLKAYIPSWCTKATVSEPTGPSPKLLTEGIARALVCSTDGDFQLSQTADELLQLASSQRLGNSSLGKLIEALEKFKRDPKSIKLDKNDTHYGIYLRNWSYFRICQRTNVLLRVFEGKRKQVLPTSLAIEYIRRAHDDSAHPGAPRVELALSSYWWPDMSEDILNYVKSCSICAKKKAIKVSQLILRSDTSPAASSRSRQS